jgi:hypothetical protein
MNGSSTKRRTAVEGIPRQERLLIEVALFSWERRRLAGVFGISINLAGETPALPGRA